MDRKITKNEALGWAIHTMVCNYAFRYFTSPSGELRKVIKKDDKDDLKLFQNRVKPLLPEMQRLQLSVTNFAEKFLKLGIDPETGKVGL